MGLKSSPIAWIARRFLTSKQADHFLSMISWVSMVGVTLGVFALTVVTSVINGFRGELSSVITGMNGDVVFYTRAEPFDEPERILERVHKVVPELESATISMVSELMASGPNGIAGLVLEGVDLSTAPDVTDLERKVVEGRLPVGKGEFALGKSLAERIGARVGETIQIVLPFGEGSGDLENLAPKSVSARVTGLVQMGFHDYDSKYGFAPIGEVRELLGIKDGATAIKLKLKEGSNAREVSDRLNAMFGFPFKSKDWGQLNQNLLRAIELEKVVIFILLTAIVIVAAFNVVSTLMMMIHDKTKEIAILKAMGLRPRQGFWLFCSIGMGIGALGTVLGIGAGLVANFILEKYRFIELPADIYRIGYLPVVVNWTEIGLIALLALLITFAGTLYPAFRVSTRPPLEGIRAE